MLLACALSCAPDESTLAGAGTVSDCSKPSASCQYTQTNPWRDDVIHRQSAYVCAAWLWACGPKPNPNPTPTPVPVQTGGSAATGGTSSAGGALATGGKAATGGTISAGGSSAIGQCADYCAKKASLGCNTDQSSCVRICTLNTSDKRFTQNVACLMSQTSKASAQKACGITSCP